MSDTNEREVATVGGGCFWCIEAVFDSIEGVESVVPGYSGGDIDDPSYREVCSGTTGHAEVVQVRFDPVVIDYAEILKVFFSVHDPTTLNRQGPDVGSQYRSIILYHTEEQKEIANAVIEELEETDGYEEPIVTEVVPLEEFFEAEAYHHDYYEKNPNAAYCQVNIKPKLEKLAAKFGGKTSIET